jgi:hypothetical protein
LRSLTETVADVTTGLPEWAPLVRPGNLATQPEQRGSTAQTHLGVVENPDVNPIVGPGRTDGQWNNELYQWQVATRCDAERLCLPPPVHLSDYLILKTGESEPWLVRVRSGDLGSTMPNIQINSTRYAVEEGTAVWGWGTFKPYPNAAYNRQDKRCGLKFQTQDGVKREDIIVYRCMTFLDRNEKLRIHTDSLRVLYDRTGTQFPSEDELPATHRRMPNGGRAAAYVPPARRANGEDEDGEDRDAPPARQGGNDAVEPEVGAGPAEYAVDCLLARKKSGGRAVGDRGRKGQWLYLVKWVGYDIHEATWEPACDISNDCIREFEDENGSADSDSDGQQSAEKTVESIRELHRYRTRRKQRFELWGSDASTSSEGNPGKDQDCSDDADDDEFETWIQERNCEATG